MRFVDRYLSRKILTKSKKDPQLIRMDDDSRVKDDIEIDE